MSETKLYKPYVGSANIQATPCTLGEYNQERGWELPANEFGGTAGYHVLYMVHGTPVHITWIPAVLFEQIFQEVSCDVGGGVVLDTLPAVTLPLYRSHKEVHAGKILFMARDDDNELLMLHLDSMANILPVPLAFLDRHKPEIGGYYVRYADGYESYSPAQAFEEGYTLVREGQDVGSN